ncbi:MAG: CPBP family intramembrane glutamic endopeptidase, partial [Planctomycetota bacterium]
LGQVLVWVTAAQRWGRGEAAIRRRARRPVPWNGDGAALAVFLVTLAVLGAAAGGADPAAGAAAEPPLLPTLADATLQLLVVVGLILLAVGWTRSNYAARPRDYGMPRSGPELARDAGLGVGVFLAALGPVYLVQASIVYGFGLPSSHPLLEALLEAPGWEAIAAAALTAVVAAPLVEELAFRVLLQGWLEKVAYRQGRAKQRNGRRAWWPIVASSAVWASAHLGQGLAPVPLLVFGLVLGYAYRQTHRLAPVLVAHLAFNALSLVVAVNDPRLRPERPAVEPPQPVVVEPAAKTAAAGAND